MIRSVLPALLALPMAMSVGAAPQVSRLTPPSELFASGQTDPVVARFLPGQRFDLQATLRPDAGQQLRDVRFFIDGKPPAGATVALRSCSEGCVKGVPAEATIATVRAVSLDKAGRHEFSVTATQDDGQTVSARGNFEIVAFASAFGPKVRNIIILLGDGMGAAQRTAARIVKGGYAQGKAVEGLAMDSFPATALVKTASLNSVVTDSAPGMTAYVSGNKNNNNEEGVFPDDTLDAFDNPRIEYLSEYLHRTQGKALGIVTTADVFDATPAGNAVHTSYRGAGTGIIDQFFDDRERTGLTVLMPAGQPGRASGEAFTRLAALLFKGAPGSSTWLNFGPSSNRQPGAAGDSRQVSDGGFGLEYRGHRDCEWRLTEAPTGQFSKEGGTAPPCHRLSCTSTACSNPTG
jgi:alkaline phosphatase